MLLRWNVVLCRFASRLEVQVMEKQGLLQAWYNSGSKSNSSSSNSSMHSSLSAMPAPHCDAGTSIRQPAVSVDSSPHRAANLVPAAAVYVKVYARDSRGDEWFYKDGYTDLRGQFDYATLTSTADMSRVTRYSLLVASTGVGAVMMQAAPPGR